MKQNMVNKNSVSHVLSNGKRYFYTVTFHEVTVFLTKDRKGLI